MQRETKMATIRRHNAVMEGTDMTKPTKMPLQEVRTKLADIVSRVHWKGERIIIVKHGSEVAALVPIADLEALLEKVDHA